MVIWKWLHCFERWK